MAVADCERRARTGGSVCRPGQSHIQALGEILGSALCLRDRDHSCAPISAARPGGRATPSSSTDTNDWPAASMAALPVDKWKSSPATATSGRRASLPTHPSPAPRPLRRTGCSRRSALRLPLLHPHALGGVTARDTQFASLGKKRGRRVGALIGKRALAEARVDQDVLVDESATARRQ